jgi:hypothetical protein
VYERVYERVYESVWECTRECTRVYESVRESVQRIYLHQLFHGRLDWSGHCAAAAHLRAQGPVVVPMQDNAGVSVMGVCVHFVVRTTYSRCLHFAGHACTLQSRISTRLGQGLPPCSGLRVTCLYMNDRENGRSIGLSGYPEKSIGLIVIN